MGYTSLMDLYHNGMGGIQGALMMLLLLPLRQNSSLHFGARL